MSPALDGITVSFLFPCLTNKHWLSHQMWPVVFLTTIYCRPFTLRSFKWLLRGSEMELIVHLYSQMPCYWRCGRIWFHSLFRSFCLFSFFPMVMYSCFYEMVDIVLFSKLMSIRIDCQAIVKKEEYFRLGFIALSVSWNGVCLLFLCNFLYS